MVTVNDINYERLSFWMQYHSDPIQGIPKKSGIYYWIYWPDFDPQAIDIKDLENRLKEYTSKSLMFSETITGSYKFHAIISEQGYPTTNDTIFGLSKSKHLKLLTYLNDKNNLTFFSNFFREVCFSRPFYVGKANNLRSRFVNQHFKGVNSNILGEIRNSIIPFTDIWIGYKEILDPANDDINNIFEEIFSRKIKPGLTKKSN